MIPAWHPVLERVYIYKTAHHPRLETDYKQPAIDAAMATAAAPTFLKPHMTEVGGRTGRRRRVGQQSDRRRRDRGDRHARLAGRPAEDPCRSGRSTNRHGLPRLRGKLPMAASVARLFMAGQAHSALGTAKIITGDVHNGRRSGASIRLRRRAGTRWTTSDRISEMRDRAFAEAREQLPELKRHFFQAPAEKFVPFHSL